MNSFTNRRFSTVLQGLSCRAVALCKMTMLLALSAVTGCVATQPRDITNVCTIFEERRSWYKAAKNSSERWGVPVSVNMAFIYQESGFRARAKPDRTRILWILPGPRPSSAFGYAQALDSTWAEYKVRSGNRRASRADFDDAVDFVAWYNAGSTRSSGIARNNAQHLSAFVCAQIGTQEHRGCVAGNAVRSISRTASVKLFVNIDTHRQFGQVV